MRPAPLAEVRARSALRWAGLDPGQRLEPTTSTNNLVWLAREHVVRISTGLTARLAREAALARQVPDGFPYPRVVAHGTGTGDDWLVTERARGIPLAHRWADLSAGQRRAAVREIADALAVLHSSAFHGHLPPLERPPHLLGAGRDAPAPLRAGLAQAGGLEHVDRGLMADLAERLDRWAPALPSMESATLIHGDLTFENLLHDGTRLTAVLDLEWARPGPADLDLDVLLRACAHPELHVAPHLAQRADPKHYQPVPAWLAEHRPAMLAVPGLPARLRIYQLAFDLRELLEAPPAHPAHTLHPSHALRRLQRLAVGRSHLDEAWVADVIGTT